MEKVKSEVKDCRVVVVAGKSCSGKTSNLARLMNGRGIIIKDEYVNLKSLLSEDEVKNLKLGVVYNFKTECLKSLIDRPSSKIIGLDLCSSTLCENIDEIKSIIENRPDKKFFISIQVNKEGLFNDDICKLSLSNLVDAVYLCDRFQELTKLEPFN